MPSGTVPCVERRTERVVGGLVAAFSLLVATSCSTAQPSGTNEETSVPVATVSRADVAPDERQASLDRPVGDDDADAARLTDAEVDDIVADLEAAGFCDPRDVEDEGIVTAMHFVVDGEIRRACYVDQAGEDVSDVVIDDDPRLIAAWDALASITPHELLDDISLVAGYEPCSSCDTLAFVSALDVEASFFIVAVDVVAAFEDPDELRLTMMHELTHVFAQEPDEQLTVSAKPDECATYHNGVGCFTPDSYVWAWIEEFWPPELLDTLPVDGATADDDDAMARCSIDPAYTSSYAALHPEEDFAETFSAFVYDVVVDPALDAKLAFFDRYPEFVEIRENARAAGLSGLTAAFDGCGD